VKKKVGALVGCTLAAACFAAGARADSVVVGASNCALAQGGRVTVPAGSTIVVRAGFAEQVRGDLVALLQDQTTTVTVGSTTTDVSGLFGPPTERADGSWASFAFLATGVTLATGDSLTFVVQTTLAHPLPEVVHPGAPSFNDAGASEPLACTVTAV
jgi:hypothetical protein